ncbi:MAG TPA: ferredoxin [Erysipelotrichaceae bacterium]|nr:ferredoxin [Erysipelotrichaceae bacterium]
MAKKRVVIDANECIMCGACVGSYPDDFEFSDEGVAIPITGEADEESVDVCPVGAISFEE